VQGVDAYARTIEQESGGRLEIALKPAGGYGKPTELVPLLEKGELDMVATVQGYYPGRFPQTSVIELPLMFDNALAGTKALGALFKEGLLAKDYAAIKVLTLYAVPPFGLFTTGKKVASLRDLRGLRIRTPGVTVGLLLAKLGAIPLGIPVSSMGEAIANGIVDAVAFPMDSALGTKGAGDKYIYEQLSVAIDLRFAAPAAMVAINQAKWDALPADLQAAIEKCSMAFALEYPRNREAAEAAARKKFEADPRYTFVPFSQQLHDEMLQAMPPVYEIWKADMTKHGIDGDHLLSRARELVQQFSVASN
jgi:TRAP-type C4-dicarboxylate transport system substrate-binding protein